MKRKSCSGLEMAGLILDLFEEKLEGHNITIPNSDRVKGDLNAARIYGDDYYGLEAAIVALLSKFSIKERAL